MESERMEFIISAANRTREAVQEAAGDLDGLLRRVRAFNAGARQAAAGAASAWRGVAGFGGQLSRIFGLARGVFGFIGGALQSATRLFAGLAGAVGRAAQAIGGALWNAVTRVFGYAMTAAKVGVIGLVAALGMLAKRGVEVGLVFEQAGRAFAIMLKSQPAAGWLMGALEKEAEQSVYSFRELVTLSSRLLAYGFGLREIIPVMRILRDTAAATGGGSAGLERIIMALGQIRAKGKISAEEMMQLTEAGVPAWALMAEQLKTTPAALMKLAEQGKLSAAQGMPALLAGLQGRFGGMEAGAMKSLQGIWSNIGDALDRISRIVTGGLVERLREAARRALEFLQNLEKTRAGQVILRNLTWLFNQIGLAIRWATDQLPRLAEWVARALRVEKIIAWRDAFIDGARRAWGWFSRVCDWISDRWDTLWAFARGVWNAFQGWIGRGWDWLKTHWQQIWNGIVGILGMAVRVIGVGLAFLGGFLGAFFANARAGGKSFSDMLAGLFSDFRAWASATIKQITLLAEQWANWGLVAAMTAAAVATAMGNVKVAAGMATAAAALYFMTRPGPSGKSPLRQAGFEAANLIAGTNMGALGEWFKNAAGSKNPLGAGAAAAADFLSQTKDMNLQQLLEHLLKAPGAGAGGTPAGEAAAGRPPAGAPPTAAGAGAHPAKPLKPPAGGFPIIPRFPGPVGFPTWPPLQPETGALIPPMPPMAGAGANAGPMAPWRPNVPGVLPGGGLESGAVTIVIPLNVNLRDLPKLAGQAVENKLEELVGKAYGGR